MGSTQFSVAFEQPFYRVENDKKDPLVRLISTSIKTDKWWVWLNPVVQIMFQNNEKMEQGVDGPAKIQTG